MIRILVIGRTGQLASALRYRASSWDNLELVFLGRPELDLQDPHSVVAHIRTIRPDAVINAAAYTAVDQAEQEPDQAFAVNCQGAANAARATAQACVPFVHMSTDYVFDGRKAEPYCEDDPTGPLNVYGHSKLQGEHAVLEEHPTALVLRTSWVYSPFGSNFLKTMLRVGAERPHLRVVADQFGNPTSALDLADAILSIIPSLRVEPGGLYHVAGSGSTNWYEFAGFIFRQGKRHGGPSPLLEAVASSEYRTLAVRPSNSQLDCTGFSKRFSVKLRHWTDGAGETVSQCLSGGAFS